MKRIAQGECPGQNARTIFPQSTMTPPKEAPGIETDSFYLSGTPDVVEAATSVLDEKGYLNNKADRTLEEGEKKVRIDVEGTHTRTILENVLFNEGVEGVTVKPVVRFAASV